MPKPLLPLTLLLIAFSHSIVVAQPAKYSVLHYTTDHGLPQNSITGIQFDQAGYCWLGTEMGLVRFDGRSFKIFNSGNVQGLRAERIRITTTDTLGNVFAQNELRQNMVIQAPEPHQAPKPVLLPPGHPMWVVRGYAMENETMANWMAAESHHTQSFNLRNGGSYHVELQQTKYAYDNRISTIDRKPGAAHHAHLPVGELFLIFEKNNRMSAWKNGQPYPAVSRVEGPIEQNKMWRNGKFSCHFSGDKSYIYAGKTLYGIYFQDGRLTSKVLLEDIDIPALDVVYFHAGQRKYYLGSLVSGLYIVSLSDFHFPQQAPDAINLGFYSQALTPDGRILCHRYLYSLNAPPEELPLPAAVGATYYLSRQGNLYYSHVPALYRFNLNTRSGKMLMSLETRPGSIYADKTDSNVIIITTSASVAKMKDDSLFALQLLPPETDMLSSVQFGKDSFILATKSGVMWYDFKQNNIYRTALDSLYIRAVYPESDQKVWISTYGKGFYLYENGRMHSMPIDGYDGLRTIHSFIEDGRGNFWLPTNNGLFTAEKKKLEDYVRNRSTAVYYYKYSVLDNLRTNEFNGGCTPAWVWTTDSMLSVPSLAGLVQFYPNRMKPLFPDHPILIDELLLNDSSVALSKNNNLLLSPDYGSFTLTVNSPYFGAPENLQLQYKLEGLNNEWHPVPSSGEIVLDGLSSGNYRVIVKKAGIDDPAAHPQLVVPITVQTPFYNTWWVQLLVAAAFVGLVLVLTKIRINVLKERNRKLQAIIREQTDDLNSTVLQLRESEKALMESNRTKDNVITMVLHDLRSPIRFLNTVITQLAKRRHEMPAEEVIEKLDLLSSSTRSLNDFTEQFFAWAVSQRQAFHVTNETFFLQDLFHELEELYADVITNNHNRLVVTATERTLHTDRNILSVVIRNLIDNANKNTRNGLIELSARGQDRTTRISVIDSGNGMTSEAIASFFNREKSDFKAGNGSMIVLNLLEKIGAALTIEQKQGGGTIFHITLHDAE